MAEKIGQPTAVDDCEYVISGDIEHTFKHPQHGLCAAKANEYPPHPPRALLPICSVYMSAHYTWPFYYL